MKYFTLFIISMCALFCTAQESNQQKLKEVIFNVNLKDHTNGQLLHADLNDSLPYMINGKIDGHNFLGIGRYTIENITFNLEPIPQKNLHNYRSKKTDSVLALEKVTFKCFVADFKDPCERTNSKSNRSNRGKYIAKFRVDLVKNQKVAKSDLLIDNKPYIFNSTKLSVYRNAIFDFEIYINGKKVKDEIEKNNRMIDGDKNFGGHICKSKITY